VPTDWAPVVQTGIGAVAAIGGGFVGAWWQARGQQRIERDRRRDRAAETAAAAIELLQDLDPYQAVEIERSNYKTKLEALTRRRLDVRGQLWVLAAGHPSKDVREHAIDTAQTLGDSLAASSGLVQSMHETLDEDAVRQARELAEQWHRTAADRLERLLEAIQRA
jgi:hypothetical protein